MNCEEAISSLLKANDTLIMMILELKALNKDLEIKVKSMASANDRLAEIEEDCQDDIGALRNEINHLIGNKRAAFAALDDWDVSQHMRACTCPICRAKGILLA